MQVVGTTGDDDLLLRDVEKAVMFGLEGNDRLEARHAINGLLDGGDGNDSLETYFVDVVHMDGGAGDDWLFASLAESAYLNGGAGNDDLAVRKTNGAFLIGGEGDDRFYLENARNIVMDGGSGNDTYNIGETKGVSIIEADDGGNDTVVVANQSYTAHRGIENIVHLGPIPATIIGNELGNIIYSYGGARIYGGGGNDLIYAELGSFINGGEGNDWITSEGNGPSDLHGNAGDDVLNGNWGGDTMEGGAGRDTFVFGGWGIGPEYLSGDAVTISDFHGWQDKIEITDSANLGIGGPGNLAAKYFFAGAGAVAQDENDRLIFDTASGELYYDADGNGEGHQVLLATINVTVGTFDQGDFLLT